jgi:hypothetical protein
MGETAEQGGGNQPDTETSSPSSPWPRLARILAVDSAAGLFRHKSFFFLMFLLIALDRVLHRHIHVDKSALGLSRLREAGPPAADYVFNDLPPLLASWLLDYRTFIILGGLFFLKQTVSLWPSSDMRRMHRDERKGLGIFSSLAAVRLTQVAWDCMAVGMAAGALALWSLPAFFIGRAVHVRSGGVSGLLLLAALLAAAWPLAMAGFSFSSKLAVLSKGTFREKTLLYLRLFYAPSLVFPSYAFFCLRILLETVFVAAIPAWLILSVENPWSRVLLGGLTATPVYSFLKMATFKFFLEIYRPHALVREEYAAYYEALDKRESGRAS